ncbi:hypothetical protein [Bacillus sp. MUM 13]|uniref:hypothetical protein n=1 Tax=Bacillus sp. MUM 13 TaxID=1678001 RepID=UPI0008F5E370|nr:hypothetical protein [Bacillus sp. MUM 13]OIK13925.1 hypothetical protein BIV59_04350 [Bacillus sp. MUM 13]
MNIAESVLALFLYFPKDKSEYIPAAITSVIFVIGAVLTMKLIISVSKKEALKTKHLEEELLKKNQISDKLK